MNPVVQQIYGKFLQTAPTPQIPQEETVLERAPSAPIAADVPEPVVPEPQPPVSAPVVIPPAEEVAVPQEKASHYPGDAGWSQPGAPQGGAPQAPEQWSDPFAYQEQLNQQAARNQQPAFPAPTPQPAAQAPQPAPAPTVAQQNASLKNTQKMYGQQVIQRGQPVPEGYQMVGYKGGNPVIEPVATANPAPTLPATTVQAAPPAAPARNDAMSRFDRKWADRAQQNVADAQWFDKHMNQDMPLVRAKNQVAQNKLDAIEQLHGKDWRKTAPISDQMDLNNDLIARAAGPVSEAQLAGAKRARPVSDPLAAAKATLAANGWSQ